MERTLSCPSCGAKVCDGEALALHVAFEHADEPEAKKIRSTTIVCEECGERLEGDAEVLGLHLQWQCMGAKKPPKKTQCQLCRKEMESEYELGLHLQYEHENSATRSPNKPDQGMPMLEADLSYHADGMISIQKAFSGRTIMW